MAALRWILKTIFATAVLAVATFVAYIEIAQFYVPDPATLHLKNGDIIFQYKMHPLSLAYREATGSNNTHAGIIRFDDHGNVKVVHATLSGVDDQNFAIWVAQGYLNHFMVMRWPDLAEVERRRLAETAYKFSGRSFDLHFLMDNDALYDGELVYRTYQDVGYKLDAPHRLDNYQLDHPATQLFTRMRWKSNPKCEGLQSSEECLRRMQQEYIVMPSTLAADSHLVTVAEH